MQNIRGITENYIPHSMKPQENTQVDEKNSNPRYVQDTLFNTKLSPSPTGNLYLRYIDFLLL